MSLFSYWISIPVFAAISPTTQTPKAISSPVQKHAQLKQQTKNNLQVITASDSDQDQEQNLKSNSAPSSAPSPQKNWDIDLGLATIYSPEFLGSKDYQLSAFPNFDIEYKDLFFISAQDGLGYNLIRSTHWKIGPVMRYAFPRQETPSDDFKIIGPQSQALQGLGDVDGTVELGGFIKYDWKEIWTSGLELRQGINGHRGLVSNWTLSYSNMFKKFGPPIIYALGPDLTWANARYNNTYWGIDPTQSINSGLAEYQMGNGLVSYGLHGFFILPFSQNLYSSLFISYERLSHALAQSPLISQRGSNHQITTGLGLDYDFGG